MVPFIPYIMAAVAAAGAAASGIQQRQLAEAQEEAQDKNNKQLALDAVAQYADLSAAEKDVHEESLDSSLQQQRAFLQAKGEIEVVAGASGTSGGSVDQMLRDLTQTKGRNLAAISNNRRNALSEIKVQAEQIRYGARARMTSRIFQKPSIGLIALNAANAGMQGYSAASSFPKTAAAAAPAGNIPDSGATVVQTLTT
jgi:biopolymer transport protein ExbD